MVHTPYLWLFRIPCKILKVPYHGVCWHIILHYVLHFLTRPVCHVAPVLPIYSVYHCFMSDGVSDKATAPSFYLVDRAAYLQTRRPSWRALVEQQQRRWPARARRRFFSNRGGWARQQQRHGRGEGGEEKPKRREFFCTTRCHCCHG